MQADRQAWATLSYLLLRLELGMGHEPALRRSDAYARVIQQCVTTHRLPDEAQIKAMKEAFDGAEEEDPDGEDQLGGWTAQRTAPNVER